MIKFSKHNIISSDIGVVNKVIKSGWLTHGKYTSLFENELNKFTGAKYSITLSSCTAALHLSCLAAGFKKGDEVIVPAQTHTATAHAVEYTGAKAVLVDVETLTGNISYNNFVKKITKKTKGVIVVHMAGFPCEIKKILKFCNRKKIKVIEDCAHALGSKVNNKHVGNFGISGCFSFYPTKQITTGEGGMVITNDKTVYKKIKMLKAFGIDKDINNRTKPGHYDVKLLGLNYRMTDFQSAMGHAQISRYKKNLIKRKLNAKIYYKFLSKIKNIKFAEYSNDCSYFIFQIFTKKRDKLIKALKNNGVGFSIHYAKSLPLMTYYKKKYNYSAANFKNSIVYSKENISLPVYPGLKHSQISRICKILKDTLN